MCMRCICEIPQQRNLTNGFLHTGQLRFAEILRKEISFWNMKVFFLQITNSRILCYPTELQKLVLIVCSYNFSLYLQLFTCRYNLREAQISDIRWKTAQVRLFSYVNGFSDYTNFLFNFCPFNFLCRLLYPFDCLRRPTVGPRMQSDKSLHGRISGLIRNFLYILTNNRFQLFTRSYFCLSTLSTSAMCVSGVSGGINFYLIRC